MQQGKSTEKESNANGEAALYESRRLDEVRKNFAFGLQKESRSAAPDTKAFRLNDQTNRN